jgi:hypothetical protein
VADFLDEFHVSFRQSDRARILLWQVRSLFESAVPRRTWRSLANSLYFSMTLPGKFVCVLLLLRSSISLGNVRLEIGPETPKKIHTPMQPSKQASTSDGSENRH